MSRNRLTHDELVEAFNEFMPKRPIYPPLVPDDLNLENSSTESEASDVEEEGISMHLRIKILFDTVMTMACRMAYTEDGAVKHPKKYLDDNIKQALEKAIQKLVNLKEKPKNPIEWLGFQLLNIHINNPDKAVSPDHLQKPKPQECEFDVETRFDVAQVIIRRVPKQRVIQLNIPQIGTKRKLPHS